MSDAFYHVYIEHVNGMRGFPAKGGCAFGAEPRLLGPEPSVLPLDDPRMIYFFKIQSSFFLPCPVFKKRSLFIASERVLNASQYRRYQGLLPDV